MIEKKNAKSLQVDILKNKKTIPEQKDNKDILGQAIAEISQESMVQGLIYSEIFGLPKCKRRGR